VSLHSKLAYEFYQKQGKRHDETLWQIRKKRDKCVKEIKEWEDLREKASKIKEYVIDNLHSLIAEFKENEKKEGIEVFFAKDAKEHNEIVYSLIKPVAKKALKSKSMLTEECGLNEFLEGKGIEVIDTDMGERIVQLRKEKPSHIVLPAIHTTKEDVAKALNTDETQPQKLVEKIRNDLRKEFLNAKVAISGANFLVAQKGWAVVCTNEGNADLACEIAPLHIISVGVEKIVPTLKDLAILLQMLAPNATGQLITAYTTLFGKKRNGKRVVILVDNGRLWTAKSDFKDILKCIRCSACITSCPVYRRSGGHSYRFEIPGPIGIVLASLKDRNKYADLPFACTLCGSCEDVCAVKIPLVKEILKARKYVNKPKFIPFIAEKVFSSKKSYDFFAKTARILPKVFYKSFFKDVSKYKQLPNFPKKRFL